jgi:hypothetical protein
VRGKVERKTNVVGVEVEIYICNGMYVSLAEQTAFSFGTFLSIFYLQLMVFTKDRCDLIFV